MRWRGSWAVSLRRRAEPLHQDPVPVSRPHPSSQGNAVLVEIRGSGRSDRENATLKTRRLSGPSLLVSGQHQGALAYLLGINALRASEAAAVRIEDYAETLRGHRVLHLVGKGTKPATMPLTVPVLRALEACRGERTEGPLIRRPVSGKPIDRRDVYRMVLRIAKVAGTPAT